MNNEVYVISKRKLYVCKCDTNCKHSYLRRYNLCFLFCSSNVVLILNCASASPENTATNRQILGALGRFWTKLFLSQVVSKCFWSSIYFKVVFQHFFLKTIEHLQVLKFLRVERRHYSKSVIFYGITNVLIY